MKHRNYRFITVLSLFLALFALASCGKNKVAATTVHEHVWEKGDTTDLTVCKHETVYTCSVCGETQTETVEDEHVWSETARLVTVPSETADGKSERYCTKCGTSGGEITMTNAAYSAQWNEEKDKAANFAIADFGGSTVTANLAAASSKSYAKPPVYPIVGHPRVLFTASSVAGIKAALKEDKNGAASIRFRSGVASMPDGQLGEATKHEVGTYKYITNATYNFDQEVLRDIQSLALDYQMTGNKITGYRAISAIKNYILTLKIVDLTSDPVRQYGEVMYTAACVYDWCYDLLTPEDKLQIVSGVEHKILTGTIDNGSKEQIEIGFPPDKRYSVAGHGCEYQLLRDYLAFAIAIYDEYPGWWDFIAGRIYEEYVEPRNYYYEAGMIPQGVSLYILVRFASDLYSAWLVKAATGTDLYETEGMKQVMRSVFAYELPNGNGFAMGDSHETKIDGDFINYGLPAMMAAYLFNDETIRAQLESREGCFTKFSDVDQDCFEYGSVSEYLICSSTGVKAASDVHRGMDLILYNGGWLGQIIARNGWGDDQATVLMKIGVRTGGNHDHQDAGQFQIWYKGMLAGDTGVYDGYSTTHRNSYHRQTIAHNSLLIKGRGQTKIGGDEMSNNNYNADDYTKTGDVIGVSYGYLDEAMTKPAYAYIAGDITPSYYDEGNSGRTTGSSSYVSEVSRRMLAVYDTGNPEVPLYFFVFDNVTAKKETYKKTFLLHTRTEPTISGNTVYEVNGEGKLVLQNVFGGDEIKAIGGAGKNYYVNNTQQTPERNATSQDDGYWGRVEISPATGKKTDQILNAIYVCDADRAPVLVASPIETADVKGAVMGKVAAVFVTKINPRTTGFTFEATGSGEMTYYVSGVKAGDWTVTAGSETKTVRATTEGKFLVFTAPAGTVTLTPQ